MRQKEVIQVNLAAANPNLSPATRFGNLVFGPARRGDTRFRGRSAKAFASRLIMRCSASR
jgi:hypothetical protein